MIVCRVIVQIIRIHMVFLVYYGCAAFVSALSTFSLSSLVVEDNNVRTVCAYEAVLHCYCNRCPVLHSYCFCYCNRHCYSAALPTVIVTDNGTITQLW